MARWAKILVLPWAVNGLENKKGVFFMINWKVRIKSVQFWIGLIGVIMSPILAYLNLSYSDLTTWESIGELFTAFFTNPFLIGTVVMAILSFIGVITDPTTKGVSDSKQAMTYTKPKE